MTTIFEPSADTHLVFIEGSKNDPLWRVSTETIPEEDVLKIENTLGVLTNRAINAAKNLLRL